MAGMLRITQVGMRLQHSPVKGLAAPLPQQLQGKNCSYIKLLLHLLLRLDATPLLTHLGEPNLQHFINQE